MPKLKKRNVLRNMKVAWAPQVHNKKRKHSEVDKENVDGFFCALKLTLNILTKVPTSHPGDAKRPCCHSPEQTAELMCLADVTCQFRHLVKPSDVELTCLADVMRQFRHLTESSDADPVHMNLDPDLAYINSPLVAIATVRRIKSVEPVIEHVGETSCALDRVSLSHVNHHALLGIRCRKMMMQMIWSMKPSFGMRKVGLSFPRHLLQRLSWGTRLSK
jgi:hypothetical protein